MFTLVCATSLKREIIRDLKFLFKLIQENYIVFQFWEETLALSKLFLVWENLLSPLLLPSLPSLRTVRGQGTKVSFRWTPNRIRKKRMVVMIQRVTATNITQPYTEYDDKKEPAIKAQWSSPRIWTGRKRGTDQKTIKHYLMIKSFLKWCSHRLHFIVSTSHL